MASRPRGAWAAGTARHVVSSAGSLTDSAGASTRRRVARAHVAPTSTATIGRAIVACMAGTKPSAKTWRVADTIWLPTAGEFVPAR